MEDFIKEPDKYDFVDSNHILSYLERTMDEECENSLMDSGGNTSDSISYSGGMNARLEATADLLDNLIKSVCHGIDESTLIDKDDSVGSSVTLEKDSSSGALNNSTSAGGSEVPGQLIYDHEGNKRETPPEINLASTDDDTESSTTDRSQADREDSKSIDRSSEGSEDSKISSSCLQEKEDSEVLVISDEGEECKGTGPAKEPHTKENQARNELELGNVGASTSAKKETQEHAFHINDNMKKGLSNLAFPSKSPSFRSSSKKSVLPPLRPKANTRITIGEALEKAQDAQKIINWKKNSSAPTDMSKYLSASNEATLHELGKVKTKPESAGSSNDFGRDSPSVENVAALGHEDQNSNPGKSSMDNENSLGKFKQRAKAAMRFKLSARMWELLRFTFDHEHFPSSVHMARLGKMMGITWSQIRNWFTNRRVDNKKAGIFPRDKVLLFCPYCKINLKTLNEQKGHLFASQHVRKILGPEYVGQSDVDAIKWKQQSEDSNSGKIAKDSVSDEEEDSESATKNLGRRWKKSFLAKNGTHTSNSGVSSGAVGAGHQKEIASENKAFDLDQMIKEEVFEEVSDKNPPKVVDTLTVKTESEENLDSYNSSLKSVNPEKRLSCIADNRSGASFCDANFYDSKPSSFEGNYDCTASLDNTPCKSSPLITRNSHSFVEPSNILSTGLRRRQKRAENYMEDNVLGYQCPTCYKIYQTEWQMIKHSMIHLLFICDICASIFPSEHILKLHLHDHLTGNYEAEKYYCQFSCKTCHSLKCECYEPLYYKPKEVPKSYTRHQKAIRSKKTFSSKPYSCPNDHLRVTFNSYQKFMQQSSTENTKQNTNFTKLGTTGMRMPQNISISSLPISTPKLDEDKMNVENKKTVESTNQVHSEKMEFSPNSSQPGLYVRKDLILESPEELEVKPDESRVSTGMYSKRNDIENHPVSEEVTKPEVEKTEVKEVPKPRKGRGRPSGRKNQPKEKTSAYVYNDGDFYYMCEICDSSFVSKSEMQDHMFFHRFKPRSRRGEKRGLSEIRKGELKRPRMDGLVSETEDETVGLYGFGRFRCNECSSHFGKVTDLSRHIKQAHCEELSSAQVLKCTYCGKMYRRERELRRHLKHACLNAPNQLKAALAAGDTVHTLHEKGEGPHFTMVDKNSDGILNRDKPVVVPKGPYECKYCFLVTRREQEMKRHIWKSCTKTPRIIKRRCKEGYSLEELGFILKVDKEENDPSPPETPEKMESAQEAIVSPFDTDSIKSPMPLPDLQGSSPSSGGMSKLPYVCAYCGIWYYREVSVAKHMKERCIIIPNSHKLILLRGGSLCDTVSSPQNSKVLTAAKGVYKMVAVDMTNEENTLATGSDSKPSEGEQSKPVHDEASKIQTPISVPTKMEEKEEMISKVEKLGSGPSKRNVNKKGTRCNRCHETFISTDAVLAHSSVHHGPKKGFYKCKLCFERFQKYKQLREHVWEHTQEMPYKCHVCDAKFRASDSIITHLQSIHNYTQAYERNLFKWLPGRNGKYRVIDNGECSQYNGEETLEGLDTNLDNLAEDMVITDDIWSEKKTTISQPTDVASTSGRVPVGNVQMEKERNQEVDPQKTRKLKTEPELFTFSDKSVCSDTKKVLDKNQVKKTSHNKSATSAGQGKSKSNEDKGNRDSVKIKSDEKKHEETLKKKTSEKRANSHTSDLSSLKFKDKRSSGDDDDELFSGNLESIIETVNLTDDRFHIFP